MQVSFHSAYIVLGQDGCLRKINLKDLWNHTISGISGTSWSVWQHHVPHTFSLGSHNY